MVQQPQEVLDQAVLSSGRSRHAFEDCVERLATAIRLGVYAYGTTLPPERELAAAMGVSRATLREAMVGCARPGWSSRPAAGAAGPWSLRRRQARASRGPARSPVGGPS